MPVILGGHAPRQWLDPRNDSPELLRPLLVPHPADAMEAFAVSDAVNSYRNQGAELVVQRG